MATRRPLSLTIAPGCRAAGRRCSPRPPRPGRRHWDGGAVDRRGPTRSATGTRWSGACCRTAPNPEGRRTSLEPGTSPGCSRGPGGRSLIGLVGGLRNGADTLVASLRTGGARPAELGSPGTRGPGRCWPGRTRGRTSAARRRSPPSPKDKLGPATGRTARRRPGSTTCTARPPTGRCAGWPRRATKPADLATTTTTDGRTVPYIVRVETGVINRSIYEYAVLHDRADRSSRARSSRPTGWNGRLVYTFGGGCPGGWYQQGSNTGGVSDDVHARPRVRRRVLVAERLRDELQRRAGGRDDGDDPRARHRDDRRAARTRSAGAARAARTRCSRSPTTTRGCWTASSRRCVFPEVGFATLHTITDALLLDTTSRPAAAGPTRRSARVGRVRQGRTIANLAGAGRRIDPRVDCPAQLPAEQRYDPATNPDGARCDVYDHQVNIWGKDPATGVARRPLDNTGIQYGLAALNAGTITVDQFLDLNERIGGFDTDANFVPQRTRGGPARGRHGVPDRAADQRRRGTGATADHRLPRVHRRTAERRHPPAVPLVHPAGAAAQGER